ncbi:hypothetical protein DYB32_006526 [Aphanomyces invadans]|uniref:Uncharacterized protein n=1 Tax=Aphanomyces invadans TaxID=157072 RepID=A0A418ARG2_9STRA|nr:hypothetical protein DYB32_006526 [Aphanomyces invadans]
MDVRSPYGRENASDTCLYGSVVGLGDAPVHALRLRSSPGRGLAMELMDDSDEDAECLSYPPTLSPVEWSATPVQTGFHQAVEMNEDIKSTTPREKLRLRRRSRSDASSTTPEKPDVCPTSCKTAPSNAPICDECELEAAVATVYCPDCDLNYCAGCDDLRHRKGKLTLHQRTALETTPPAEIPVAPLTTQQWTTNDVANWLESLGLQVYETAFQQKDIDGAALLMLPPHGLDALDQLSHGSSRGHKKKLQREIQRLKDEFHQQHHQRQDTEKHSQLRVTVDSTMLQRRRSDMASPVTALRAKYVLFEYPLLRRKVANLGLDLNQMAEKSVKASFDFTAEGRLQSHGFEINKRHQMLRELKSLYANFVSLNETARAAGAACQDLVMFYDAFTNPEIGSVSIVLEYMDGGSLEGLSFLHDNRQLHRDIKLSNILVNKAGRVKISDFGISRELESTLAEAMTFTGTLLYAL